MSNEQVLENFPPIFKLQTVINIHSTNRRQKISQPYWQGTLNLQSNDL